jgi:hypothetical protein
METIFNREELDLLHNREWFKMKAAAAGKTVLFLEQLNELIKQDNNLVFNVTQGASKISRGENLKGYPYFVLDVPKLGSAGNTMSLRVLVWWGYYVSLNLLMDEPVLERYRGTIRKNMNHIRSSGFFVSVADDHWQHDVHHETHYIKGSDFDEEQLGRMKVFKLSARLELEEMNSETVWMEKINGLNRTLL